MPDRPRLKPLRTAPEPPAQAASDGPPGTDWATGAPGVSMLYAAALLLAAFLLFAVEPMVAKAFLPILGGTPAVWTTCMAFFQVTLLAAYAYAHLASSRLEPRTAAALHLGFVGLVLVAAADSLLPDPSVAPAPAADPRGWLIGALTVTVGLPFFAIAATAPLLQRWFAGSGHRLSSDPYPLYAASNLGSLLALLAYPTVIEPHLRLAQQAVLWRAGFAALAILLVICALVLWRSRPDRSDAAGGNAGDGGGNRVTTARWLRWAALAAIPASWLLGVTAYLSTDIAAAPLLWVVPLALYLLTLIVAFARQPLPPHAWSLRLFPIAALLLTPALAAGLVQPFWIPVHLATFFLGALVCHGELVRDRPGTDHLTGYYLALAAGGAAGGLFNALVAPVVFDRIAEYPLALVLALLVVPATCAPTRSRPPLRSRSRTRSRSPSRPWVRVVLLPAAVLVLSAALVRNLFGLAVSPAGVLSLMVVAGLVALATASYRSQPRRYALTIGAVLLACGLSAGVDGRTLVRKRNFYGVLRVTNAEPQRLQRLFHGSTLHGQQSTEPALRGIPLSYFHPTGPIGQVFEAYQARPARPSVAVIGLGIGSLAAYARPEQRWTFYEIDPAVVRLARDPRYFTHIRDSRAGRITFVLGDARLRLSSAPDGAYGLIVVDAFSSDAPPVHLLTREALDLYRRKLAPGGLIAVNLSNRYLDLDPVLGPLAAATGMVCRVRYEVEIDPAQRAAGKLPSIWGVVADRQSDLGPLADDPRWRPARRLANGAVWTDDWSSLISAWRTHPLDRSPTSQLD